MTKKTSLRNTLLIGLLTVTLLYVFFHLVGFKSRYSVDQAVDDRQTLFEEVENERKKQEFDELDKIQQAIDQTDLGTLPQ